MAQAPLAPTRKTKARRGTKAKSSSRKQTKARKKTKSSADEKIELEGIETFVYQKSFKPKPVETS